MHFLFCPFDICLFTYISAERAQFGEFRVEDRKKAAQQQTHTHTLRQKMLRIYMLIENHVLFGRNACDVNLPETEFSKQMLLMVKLFDYHHHKLSSVD